LFIDTNYRLSYCSALVMAQLVASGLDHARELGHELHVKRPSFNSSHDISRNKSRGNRKVKDHTGKEHFTRLNYAGPLCQAMLACFFNALLNHIRYDSYGNERCNGEEEKVGVIVQFLETMIELCDYGVCIRSSGDSKKSQIYRHFMGERDYGCSVLSLVNELQYIKYSGPVDVEAVLQVSAFLQGDGEGDLPTIDCLKKAILTMCAINDAEWSMDDGCDYLTPTSIFVPTHLEICVEADKGMGNGGMDPDEYFNVPSGTCGAQHP